MLRRIAVLSLSGALTAGVAACASSASTTGGSPAQQSSQMSVTITSPATENSYAIWVAQAEGFFTGQGLNLKLIPSSSGGADTIAVVASGSAQFAVEDALVPTNAIEKGADIKYVLMPETGDAQQLSISEKAPGASKIKAASSATAQLKALKGSHYTIGVSTVASSSYSFLYTATHLYGLSTASGGDVSINTLGTPQNEIVAIKAGKVDAVAGVPPTTTQEGTFSIPMDEISPFGQMAGSWLLGNDKFIAAQPKATQAVVTALVQACNFIAKNSAKAEQDVVKALQAADPTITTKKAESNFQASLPHFMSPYPAQGAYQLLAKLTNGSPPAGPFPAYTTAVDPSFAKAALVKLGLPVPTGS
jgi:ABC-type nitrate/sulfonate/bicarbonate transport system substrate-binding protein